MNRSKIIGVIFLLLLVFAGYFNGRVIFNYFGAGITPSEIEAISVSNVILENGFSNLDSFCKGKQGYDFNCKNEEFNIKIQIGMVFMSTVGKLVFGFNQGPYVYYYLVFISTILFLFLFLRRFFGYKILILVLLQFLLYPTVIHRNNHFFGNYFGFIFLIYGIYLIGLSIERKDNRFLYIAATVLGRAFILRIETAIACLIIGFSYLYYKRKEKSTIEFFLIIVKGLLVFVVFTGPLYILNYQLNDSPLRFGYTQKLINDAVSRAEVGIISTNVVKELDKLSALSQNFKRFPLIRQPFKSFSWSERYYWLKDRLRLDNFRFNGLFVFSVFSILYFLSVTFALYKKRSDRFIICAFSIFSIYIYVSELMSYHWGWDKTAISYYTRYWSSFYFLASFAIIVTLFKFVHKKEIYLIIVSYVILNTFAFNGLSKAKLQEKYKEYKINEALALYLDPGSVLVTQYFAPRQYQFFDKLDDILIIQPYNPIKENSNGMRKNMNLDRKGILDGMKLINKEYGNVLVLEYTANKKTYANAYSFFLNNGYDVELVDLGDASYLNNLSVFILKK